jgi:hypothetical protein
VDGDHGRASEVGAQLVSVGDRLGVGGDLRAQRGVVVPAQVLGELARLERRTSTPTRLAQAAD